MADTTALFALLNALLVALRADATLAANSVVVVDGPYVSDLSAPNVLFVGGTGPDDDSDTAGTFTQRFDLMGSGGAKDEQIAVTCDLWARSGGTDMATVRATIATLLSAIELLLRSNLTLGVGRVRWVSLSSGDYRQIQANTGSSAACTFTITASVRLF